MLSVQSVSLETTGSALAVMATIASLLVTDTFRAKRRIDGLSQKWSVPRDNPGKLRVHEYSCQDDVRRLLNLKEDQYGNDLK